MPSYDEQIVELEKELATTKYNKATQHHVGLVKAKLAKLKEKQEKRGSGGKKGEGYSVRKTGDGTVLLLGFPSVGKSTLLNQLTGAKSEVGAYDFTTLDVVPGIMEYKHAKIQILDVPGIVRGAASGRGRGREVLSVMRNADLCLMILDVHHPEHLKVLQKEVYDSGIRLNQRRPDVKIKKTNKDGIRVGATVKLTHLNRETIQAILKEFRINNAEVLIRENITDDQLIDCIEDNKQYLYGLICINKADTANLETLHRVMKETCANLAISAEKGQNIAPLRELIFKRLRLIRIFMKEPGKEADMKVPMIMFEGSSVQTVCEKLHRDFVRKFKFVKITGPSSKFPGQKLSLKHALKDGDMVELHLS
ncbi:MAG TPA: GTP-binding protein [Candidatus Nanoarchaeia archaeon]|nr:GTP-binding protein [Candidatus Nanoarchaeia archaeon]